MDAFEQKAGELSIRADASTHRARAMHHSELTYSLRFFLFGCGLHSNLDGLQQQQSIGELLNRKESMH